MKQLKLRLTAAALVLAALASYQPLQAQLLYGSVVGSVQDPSGAVVPNVNITLTNKSTGAQRQDQTDASGNYSINNLLPGAYDISASGAGFRTASRTNVEILANTVS